MNQAIPHDQDEEDYLRDQDRSRRQKQNRFIHDPETPDDEEE